MKSNLFTLKVFDNAPEAHVLISKLENSGINCHLHDAFTISIEPVLSQAIGGVKLIVHLDDKENALAIVKEIEGVPITDETNNVLECPKCGATDIYANFKTMRGIWAVFYIIMSFLFLLFPFMFKNVYRCKKCEHEFKKK